MYIAYKKKEQRKGMTVRAFLLIIGMAFFVGWIAPEKKYKLEQTGSEWAKTYNGLEYTKTQIKYSDLPSKTATFIIDSIISPLQNEIFKQVNPPLQADQKALQDSLKNKSKN